MRGGWRGDGGARLPITLTEEQVTYFATVKVSRFTPDRFGVFGYLADDGLYYGFPVYGEVAVKIGIDGAGPVVTPETRTYARDEARVRRAWPAPAAERLSREAVGVAPQAAPGVLSSQCMMPATLGRPSATRRYFSASSGSAPSRR